MDVRDLETVYEIAKLKQVPIHWWNFAAILQKKALRVCRYTLGKSV